MIKLIDLANKIVKMNLFDMEAIENDYKYYPFYDDLIKYSIKKDKAENCGTTYFSWYADITKDEAIGFLKDKYTKYLV